ncbi:hypothetical protein B5F40_03695 [Gordonibacter sp. An230]|uniref:hypothetical protein n=1 Tax=Gordonibacter sp. An230 TaxID=1965592 RepID=UPI000B58326B|nr:hypothetical protein [Gordonibacter sp. An230]OUO91545.1 hypothetical protein B5F40_03695 [Gordonibacter sp. An230]
MSARPPAFEQRFVFDEHLFRRYYLLHLRPHEKGMGPSLNPFDPRACGARIDGAASALLALACASILVGLLEVLLGLWYVRGRRPNWESRAWKARVGKSFESVKAGSHSCPYDPCIESKVSFLSLFVQPQSIGDSWADEDLFLPPWGLGSNVPDPRAGVPCEVVFSVRLFSDRVEKGESASFPYSAIHDVLEHRRFPDIAIIRSREFGETLLLKDGFGSSSWEEVRGFIEERMGNSEGRGR